jgi:hypothetical protein
MPDPRTLTVAIAVYPPDCQYLIPSKFDHFYTTLGLATGDHRRPRQTGEEATLQGTRDALYLRVERSRFGVPGNR